MRSDPVLKKWYKKINQKFFGGVLTNSVCVRWADQDEEGDEWEDRYFGTADRASDSHHEWEIVLSRTLNKKAVVRLSTLAHEMIHIATELRDNHGPVFEEWRQLISDRGIFKKHALYKNMTLF